MKTKPPKYKNEAKIRKAFEQSQKIQDFLKYYPKTDANGKAKNKSLNS
jgi:hypothetical protein